LEEEHLGTEEKGLEEFGMDLSFVV
jgi:hypothetical protein